MTVSVVITPGASRNSLPTPIFKTPKSSPPSAPTSDYRPLPHMPSQLDTARLRERLISLTRDFVLIPGSAERPDELQRSIHWVRNHLESLEGITVDLYESNGLPSLVARPANDHPIDVLFCAHIDVVHHSDASTYKSELRDNRIYGPGTGDMKGIVAILLELFRRFHLQSPGIPLGLAITTDEESGGDNGTRALFEDFGVKCNVAMVPDGGGIDDIVVEEKGILQLKLESTGRACHAARPWLGHNALEQLQTTIASIQSQFPPLNADLFHWHPTCSVTRIDTPNRSVNRIPSHATATLDVRFPAPQDCQSVLADLTNHIGPNITSETLIAAEPTILSPDPAFFDACEAVLGHRPREHREHGGSDARFISRQNIPVIMSRPLCHNLHSSEEWIDIDSMISCYEIYRHYLIDRLLNND